MFNTKPLVALFEKHLYAFRTHELFGWLLDDVLAGFGVPIEYPPRAESHELLKELSGQYASLVRDHAPFSDLLGQLYMALAYRSVKGSMGQYFSPPNLATMMAEITIGGGEMPRGQPVRVCDPACGSGVMLLSTAEVVLRRHGEDSLKDLSLTGTDIDPLCSKMAAVQLLGSCAMHGLSLGEVVIYRGNSLGSPQDLTVVVHASNPAFDASPPAHHPARVAALQEAAAR